MPARRTNIVLIGFMGSGKSSIGKLVAGRMGFQFMDTDAVIAKRAGMAIPAIFAQFGEERFREMETAAIESLAQFTRCVIATGGGAVLQERNRALLRELGFVVCLTASEETIYERVARNSKRPLLQTENPRETVTKMLAARQSLYQETADLMLDTTTFSREQAGDAVIAAARRGFSWQVAE